MGNVTENEKKNLSQKFLEFQRSGLISYGKYLEDQLVNSANSEIRKAYIKYIEDQLVMNKEKISKINEKLK